MTPSLDGYSDSGGSVARSKVAIAQVHLILIAHRRHTRRDSRCGHLFVRELEPWAHRDHRLDRLRSKHGTVLPATAGSSTLKNCGAPKRVERTFVSMTSLSAMLNAWSNCNWLLLSAHMAFAMR